MKVQSMFHVSFDIPQNRLTTVLEVLTKEVSNLQVTTVGNGPITTAVMPPKKRVITQSKGSPITEAVRAWVQQMPSGTEFNLKQVKTFLKENNFKESNCSPQMSLMNNIYKLIVSPAKGLYRRR
jgi:hypothetical protein